MDKYYLPSSLDGPLTVCLLTIDELIALLVPIFIGMICDVDAIGFVTGLGLGCLLKHFKSGKNPHIIRHLLYWHLPPLLPFKKMPPAYQRLYRG